MAKAQTPGALFITNSMYEKWPFIDAQSRTDERRRYRDRWEIITFPGLRHSTPNWMLSFPHEYVIDTPTETLTYKDAIWGNGCPRPPDRCTNGMKVYTPDNKR